MYVYGYLFRKVVKRCGTVDEPAKEPTLSESSVALSCRSWCAREVRMGGRRERGVPGSFIPFVARLRFETAPLLEKNTRPDSQTEPSTPRTPATHPDNIALPT
jgi:hypothetical protein